MLLIEGDSLLIINAYREQLVCNWKIAHILQKVKQILYDFDSYQTNRVYREANKAADELANIAIAQAGEFDTFVKDDITMPQRHLQVLRDDMM
ncbi:hypothetical protein SUGI_0847880 [Cryptomeria japonica]|nr:hypothetical protein SUGI_0847880 [Cryptomeria japonica]